MRVRANLHDHEKAAAPASAPTA